ncbi:MAG TPA: hypothetical protein VG986_03860 [Pseudolabrys sp.]|nr:hypothetical protein [Pseudolabrys sp.]
MRLLLAGLLAIACGQFANAETVHSLDQVPNRLKTPEAKKFFSEQMQGKPAPDLLGVHLPAGFSIEAIVGALVPPNDKGKPHLVGAKPWPARPNSYVAIVCTGGSEPYSAGESSCARSPNDDKEPPLRVYLGVLARNDGGAVSLAAASGAIDCATDWSRTNLPRQPSAADDAKDGLVKPESFDRFDLANYKIAPDQIAFGLRGAWSEGYAGGGANFTALCLFVPDGSRLRQVLAAPMSAYADIAGDWHKDGTRDHDITDAANLLVLSRHRTDGYFDLLLKNRGHDKTQIFHWVKSAAGYRPSN